jgi:hypothetical protein
MYINEFNISLDLIKFRFSIENAEKVVNMERNHLELIYLKLILLQIPNLLPKKQEITLSSYLKRLLYAAIIEIKTINTIKITYEFL